MEILTWVFTICGAATLARGFMAFVDALDCRRLIVHCWEGVSRSAAVALAVRAYRGGGDALSACGPLRPNPRVHALACRALGIRP